MATAFINSNSLNVFVWLIQETKLCTEDSPFNNMVRNKKIKKYLENNNAYSNGMIEKLSNFAYGFVPFLQAMDQYGEDGNGYIPDEHACFLIKYYGKKGGATLNDAFYLLDQSIEKNNISYSHGFTTTRAASTNIISVRYNGDPFLVNFLEDFIEYLNHSVVFSSCKQCHILYTKTRSDMVFCSASCRSAHRRTVIVKDSSN